MNNMIQLLNFFALNESSEIESPDRDVKVWLEVMLIFLATTYPNIFRYARALKHSVVRSFIFIMLTQAIMRTLKLSGE